MDRSRASTPARSSGSVSPPADRSAVDGAATEAIIVERRRLGIDGHDEVWDGVYHVVPTGNSDHGDLRSEIGEVLGPLARAVGLRAIGEFNLGHADDYRVPDFGVRPPSVRGIFLPATVVGEILSPNDESFKKFGFYWAHGVQEIWIVDPIARTVRCHLPDGSIQSRSRVLNAVCADVEAAIHWP